VSTLEAMPSTCIFVLMAIRGISTCAASSPDGSCGANKAPECLNDMASCGNACCSAEFRPDLSPGEVFDSIKSYLESGGSDGLFSYVDKGLGGALPDGVPGGWKSIFQGKHQTFIKKYNDTLNFAVRPGVVRVFSISEISGALGDMGQNRRTVTMLAEDLKFGPMSVLFGCGSSPSIPIATEDMPMRATADASKVASMWVDRPKVSLMLPAVLDRAFFIAVGSAIALVCSRVRAQSAHGDTSGQYMLVA